MCPSDHQAFQHTMQSLVTDITILEAKVLPENRDGARVPHAQELEVREKLIESVLDWGS